MASIQIHPNLNIAYREILEGLSKSDLPDLERFLDQVSTIIARKKAKDPSAREIELIKKIYDKFPSGKQERYDKLFQKLKEETIEAAEQKELEELNEAAEQHRSEWLGALVELAQLRGVSIFEVKKQLGIEIFDPVK